ncbi:unnamed protein product [Spirodela intermedia]|uniref:Uncharacterized protein n=1 Tax=Spirodela intermedia TaxID=51605 RepID=A0A7I8L3T3_SPIIN|nr:unnamed protein product [Spirodela intermedia]
MGIELGDKVRHVHSTKHDESQIYRLVQKSLTVVQGTLIVMKYASELKFIWREINHYRPIKNPDTEEQNYIMKDRLYKFLMGLNLQYETLVNQILAQEIKIHGKPPNYGKLHLANAQNEDGVAPMIQGGASQDGSTSSQPLEIGKLREEIEQLKSMISSTSLAHQHVFPTDNNQVSSCDIPVPEKHDLHIEILKENEALEMLPRPNRFGRGYYKRKQRFSGNLIFRKKIKVHTWAGRGAHYLFIQGGTSLMTSHWARGAPNPPTHSSISVQLTCTDRPLLFNHDVQRHP